MGGANGEVSTSLGTGSSSGGNARGSSVSHNSRSIGALGGSSGSKAEMSENARQNSKSSMVLMKPPHWKSGRMSTHTLTTQKGRIADLNNEQNLTKFDGTGFKEVKLENLKKGDSILVPRLVDVAKNIKDNLSNPKLDVTDFLRQKNPRIIEANPSSKQIIDDLIAKYGTRKAVAEELSMKPKTLEEYHKGRNNISYSNYKKLANLNGNQVDVTRIKGERQGIVFNIPKEVNPKFAEFLGLLHSDGGLKGRSSIHFYNNSPDLRQWFSNLAGEVFGVFTKEDMANTVKTEMFNNKMASDFLQWMGMPSEKKSNNIFIPDQIKFGELSLAKSYLNGYIAGDGSFYKYTLELSTSSQKMKDDLNFLISRFGVVSRASTRPDEKNHRISVEGKEVSKLAPHLYNEKDHRKTSNLQNYVNKMENKRHFQSSGAIPIDPNLIRSVPRNLINHDKQATNMYDNVVYSSQKVVDNTLKHFNQILKGAIRDKNIGPRSSASQVSKKLDAIIIKLDSGYLDIVKTIEKIE